jgi:glycerophosphoryl diester phosphodiesterase
MKKYFILIMTFYLSVVHAFDWQGHRGARGLYPENTIGGMLEAAKYPITTLEFDVVVTRDKKVILSHEPWLGEEICWDLKGQPVKEKQVNLYQLTAEEIQRFARIKASPALSATAQGEEQ